ncbi:DUF1684 domain-containing protein [Scrofimicrobium sp. R131]|uniref:DUF1684 domain-containing protein n=1 Tax=Scrofimicrobium appendicitidis TaxID=3079930 RepID=A0AAU7V6A4_9ACTO
MDAINHRAAWEQWREHRNETLRQPHGWLSLVNLEWVGDTAAPLSSFPGIWSAKDHQVTATFSPEDQVTRDGHPVVGQVHLEIPRGESDTSLLDARGRQAEVASRFGRIAVRTRDPEAPTRTNFSETRTFDFDPKWIVTVEWEPYPEPTEVTVPSAHQSKPMTLTAQGSATVFGQKVTITGSDRDHLGLIFHDETNGNQTEGWRSAPAKLDDGRLTIDFNRAVNFPAHFTPYGTCPTPPAGNTLPVAVTAGEKKNR